MKNMIQSGKTLTFMAAASVSAGQGFLLGDAGLFGVSATSVIAGEEGEACVAGVFELPVAAVNAAAFDVAYFDADQNLITNIATNNTKVGYFTEASTGAGVCRVLIAPVL